MKFQNGLLALAIGVSGVSLGYGGLGHPSMMGIFGPSLCSTNLAHEAWKAVKAEKARVEGKEVVFHPGPFLADKRGVIAIGVHDREWKTSDPWYRIFMRVNARSQDFSAKVVKVEDGGSLGVILYKIQHPEFEEELTVSVTVAGLSIWSGPLELLVTPVSE